MAERSPDGVPNTTEVDVDRRCMLGEVARSLLAGGMVAAGLGACSSTPSRSTGVQPDWPTPGRGSTRSASTEIVKPSTAGADQRFRHVAARASWTGVKPDYADMNRMTPIRAITVHHDGLPTPLASSRTRDTEDRLRLIQRAHVNSRGWADIGYHYAIDRAGRVWACRPVTWQGAHVKNRNEGNIGVLVLGNFETERPSTAQLSGLAMHLKTLSVAYRVPVSRIYTHREWPGAATQCPGRNLQPSINRIRSRGLVA